MHQNTKRYKKLLRYKFNNDIMQANRRDECLLQ